MSLRTLLLFAAVAMAFVLVAPVKAAPAAQASIDDVVVDEVVVTSMSAFTLTVRIDEVTTVAIPLQIDWRAEGPNADSPDEVLVVVAPTVLRTGFFSVTVGPLEPMIGTLAVTLTQPIDEIVAITDTATTTTTATTTATVVTTDTAAPPGDLPALDTATANAISNLRAGPGTDFAVVGSTEVGAALDVVGQNGDGTWLTLANGAWIAAFLVNNAPVGLPIVEPAVEPAPTPLPSPTTSDILTPTVTPTP